MTPKKKLTLNKETLRQLTDEQLDSVAGATGWECPIPPPPPSMFCSNGCITDGLCSVPYRVGF